MNRAKVYIKSEISETDATISFNLPWYHGMASDFSNIRFFMSPYRIIPHWIETYTSDSAKVWIKLPSIHPGINVVFVEWGNWNNGCGDIEGISFQRIGDNFEETSLDTSKWNSGIGSAGGSINVSDSTVVLSPNVPSSGGNACVIWSVQTVTNNIIIRERRKFTDEYYADIGLTKNLDYLDTWHIFEADNIGYSYNMQTPISGNARIDVSITRRDTGSKTTLASLDQGGLTSTDNFHITECIYKSDGTLIYIHTPSTGEPGWNLSATDTTYLSDSKYVVLWQGKYESGAGGISYIDWVFVRKYLDPEPEVIDIQILRINKYILYFLYRPRITVFPLIRELIPKQTNVYTKIQEICERSMKTYTQIREVTEREEGIQTAVIESINYTTNIFTQVDELVNATLNSVDKLQYLKSSHNVIIYNNVFPFPAMKIDSATTNENVTIYTSLNAPEQKNYTVFTIPAGTEDTIIESDPISLTGSISISFEGSLPSNATAYVSVNNTLYQMKNIGNYYYRTVRGITSSDTVKFIIKSTSADTDTKVFIRNIQIENADEPTAYVSAGSSRDAGFLSYNFDPEKIKAIMLYVYTPESSNEKTILYMPASNVYLYVKSSKVYLNGSEILDWANDQWNLVYIDSNGVRVNTDSYSTTINFLSDTLYVAQKNGENHLNGFISMLTFLKKELSDPVKVMSSLIVR